MYQVIINQIKNDYFGNGRILITFPYELIQFSKNGKPVNKQCQWSNGLISVCIEANFKPLKVKSVSDFSNGVKIAIVESEG